MRKYPCGAEKTTSGVSFRVWAPKCTHVAVVLENQQIYSLEPKENGYFSKHIESLPANTRYQFRLDQQERLLPDPASRFQPEGPHGPSQIIDPGQFNWTDGSWEGIRDRNKVIIYELHIGTFTPKGTWLSACEKLPYLADLGINVIEMQPIADFCGHFNWGYDGVNLFAPTRNYGTPDDLRTFINLAHELGLGVILDVVYNHFGPSGNYLNEFSEFYLKKAMTEWGDAINFDGPESQEVRAFFCANAGYWIDEYHFDGLRLDACHAIHDDSSPHILAEITQEVRKRGGSKTTYVTAENEQQEIKATFPLEEGGYGMDAVWNEDFHHSAFVRLTSHNEAYYNDYLGKSQEFISTVKHGFLYQGQWYAWQEKRRGSPSLHVRPSAFIIFLENHDQVANSGGSLRLHHFSQPGAYRAMVALFLLSPQIPLIFQGQEFGSTVPFFYFSEMPPDLAKLVHKGRVEFVSQFASFNTPDVQANIPNPHDRETFVKSKLNWEEKNSAPFIYNLFKDLIKLRKEDSVFKLLGALNIEGAVINDDAFILRFMGAQEERLVLINFGVDVALVPSPEPLLAPPSNHIWEIFWSSENPEYGGFGNLEIPSEGNWHLSGCSALILYPKPL